MNTREMGRDYLGRAKRCLAEAEAALNDEDYSMTVRRSQECIEMAIKGVLRLVGIEFPREHDVSDVLLQTDWRQIGAPSWFIEDFEKLASIMREITPKRGPAMYGFEKEMKPAGEIFSAEDGIKALNEARFVYESCQKFYQEWK